MKSLIASPSINAKFVRTCVVYVPALSLQSPLLLLPQHVGLCLLVLKLMMLYVQMAIVAVHWHHSTVQNDAVSVLVSRAHLQMPILFC